VAGSMHTAYADDKYQRVGLAIYSSSCLTTVDRVAVHSVSQEIVSHVALIVKVWGTKRYTPCGKNSLFTTGAICVGQQYERGP